MTDGYTSVFTCGCLQTASVALNQMTLARWQTLTTIVGPSSGI